MQNDDFEQGLICPSFNSYSSDKLADVAAKVCREFDNLGLLEEDANDNTASSNHNDDEEEFEFVSFQKSDDHVFLDGNQIGPVFPVFNRDLLLNRSQGDLTASINKKAEDDDLPSSSSSDVDELEAVPQGTYCVWMPKGGSSSAQAARGKCKKSKSTGTSSSRRWSLKDLLKRSNSEGGKDSLVLLTPLPSSSSTPRSGSGPDGPKPNSKKGQNAVSLAHEAFYVRNKTVPKDGYNKRRSYLPYRQDLVGFFASVNAMSRTFPAL